MLVIDQIGREVAIPKPPSRIVSLVPSITELLVDLNLGEQLCGVTKFCVRPQDVRDSKTVVGGTKTIHFDRIAALQPDLIICNKEENTQEMVSNLESEHTVWVSDISTIEDCLNMIAALGEICDRSSVAQDLIGKIQVSRKKLIESVERFPPIAVVYLIWKDPLMAAGKGTYIDHMLELCKLDNTVHESRYPELDQKAMHAADVILLSSEPYPFKEKDVVLVEKDFEKPGVLADGESFSWYGTRLLYSLEYLRSFRGRLAALVS